MYLGYGRYGRCPGRHATGLFFDICYQIKNFNHYGYDLSIHPQSAEGDAHFRTHLECLALQSVSDNTHVHLAADTQQSTEHKTASAQGLLR